MIEPLIFTPYHQTIYTRVLSNAQYGINVLKPHD